VIWNTKIVLVANAYISGLEEGKITGNVQNIWIKTKSLYVPWRNPCDGLGLQLDGDCFQLWISADADTFKYDFIAHTPVGIPADLGGDMVPVDVCYGNCADCWRCIYHTILTWPIWSWILAVSVNSSWNWNVVAALIKSINPLSVV
jgi:hypothetical protein